MNVNNDILGIIQTKQLAWCRRMRRTEQNVIANEGREASSKSRRLRGGGTELTKIDEEW